MTSARECAAWVTSTRFLSTLPVCATRCCWPRRSMCLPDEVIIFGVQPANLDWEDGLSPQVEATLPGLVRPCWPKQRQSTEMGGRSSDHKLLTTVY